MLATLPHQGHGLPDISINDGHAHASLPDPGLVSKHALCPGCKTSAVNDNGGLVVAFGLVSLPPFNLMSLAA
ncbi:hypothetical protein JAAARDRAFT_329058 [Jaapia argillacea MUCL 33604]|uniref:Uncharacterized protein n=1 Tax=Jaapia argillacea MUCL 33604 TaxID=933084 RepID=A0A067PLJ2_9AGAM|nr:hypothetical protein JAAARDRAFT_329058 [Jaapia argillacea MUCL 33604]